MKVIENHYTLQMEANSSIEPTFIQLVCGRVVITTLARPVDDKFDAWVKQT
jgi:hypothetical protein